MSDKFVMTTESVQADLHRAFLSAGPGSAEARAANMILQNLTTLLDRIRMPNFLEAHYLRYSEEASPLPIAAYRLIERVVSYEIDADDAEEELEEMIRSFEKIFAEMGINPTTAKAFIFTQQAISESNSR